jgi:fibronectin type 3 domain-containing protein
MFQPGIDGATNVRGGFKLIDKRTVGFQIDEGLDPSRQLIIDPGMEFSSFIGGENDVDEIIRTFMDGEDILYVVGTTNSDEFPTTSGAFSEIHGGGSDMFAMKFNLSRKSLLFSSFIGGSEWDRVSHSFLLDDGNIFIAGRVFSDDFPTTTDAVDRTYYDGEAVLLKLKGDGSDISYSTYFGGDGDETITAVSLDHNGLLTFCGYTDSTDLPTTQGAYCRTYSSNADVFVARLDGSWENVDLCTYIGGFERDIAQTMILDEDGDIFITGNTNSSDFPTTVGAFCRTVPALTDFDVFALKLDSSGSSLFYSTYIGGSDDDLINTGNLMNMETVFLLDDGSLIIGGLTESVDFPVTAGAFCQTYNGTTEDDIFVLRLNPAGSALIGSTYLGGDGTERLTALVATDDGRVYLAGETISRNFPTTPDAINVRWIGDFINYDLFFVILDDTLSTMEYGTYLGGAGPDYLNDLMTSYDNTIVAFVGRTLSRDFPTTPGCFDPINRGELDGFLLIINVSSNDYEYSTLFGGSSNDAAIITIQTSEGHYILIGGASSMDFPMSPNHYDNTYNGGQYDAFIVEIDPRPLEPTVPTGLIAESGIGYVNLTWNVFGFARFLSHNIYWGTSPDTMQLIGISTPDAITFFHDDPVNGTLNYYCISMVVGTQEGPLSDIVSIRPIGIPTIPLGFELETGNGTVQLNWSEPHSPGGIPIQYRVYKGQLRDQMVPIATVGETQYVDTDVEVGEFYYYAILAFNKHGDSPITAALRIKALNTPSQPREFKVISEDGQVRMSWNLPQRDGGTMILGFHVWRMTGSGPMELIATLGPNHLSFTDTNVTNGQSYVYKVTAFSEVGDGKDTLTLDAIPFGLPGEVLEIVATGDDGQVTLEWDPPESDGGSQILRYHIHWGTDMGNLDQTYTIGNKLSFTHTGLANGVTYYYQIEAENAAGLGPVSIVVSATPMGLPGTVKDLVVKVVPVGVRLTWSLPSNTGGATSLTYKVLRGTTDDPRDEIAALTDSFVHNDTDVTLGTTYYYRILVVSSVGEGPMIDPISVTVAGAPGEVTPVTVDAGDAKVELSWTAPDDGGSPITNYIILRGIFETGLAEIGRVGADIHNYTDDSVENGMTYLYKVYAINAVGAGTHSDSVSATPRGPPGPPGVLEAKAKGRTIKLSWTAPPAGNTATVTGYKVYRGPSEAEMELLEELGDVLTYTDKDVKEGRAFYYKVVATSDSGDSEMSRLAKAKVRSEDSPGFGVAMTGLALLAGLAVPVVHSRMGSKGQR